MHRRDRLEGCLLGCAVGDSIGLPYEGLGPRRIARLLRRPLMQSLLFGRGMVSDDTDHTIFVAQSMSRHPRNAEAFQRALAGRLKRWLLCLPAGIGLATLRSTLKLCMGVPPAHSGVRSAGNGAAMRAAVIGAFLCENAELRAQFVAAATRLTHTDPRALCGASAVAEVAAHTARSPGRPSTDDLQELLSRAGEGKEWLETVARTIDACRSGTAERALPETIRGRGVSGYVFHTVPVAVAAWFIHFGDFPATIEAVVRLGGDTDTVAAIAGALAGISSGPSGIPAEWVNHLIDQPHSPAYIRRLAESLDKEQTAHTNFSWLQFPRGIWFTGVVLAHGFRRLLPPY